MTLVLFFSQVAAEHSSAETAEVLLNKGASAGVKDDTGLSVFVLFILKMPSVVSAIYRNNSSFTPGASETQESDKYRTLWPSALLRVSGFFSNKTKIILLLK